MNPGRPVDPRLFAVAGPLAGGAFPLGAALFTLGRQDTCDLRIRDRAVSRQHCTIALDGDRFVVRDLDSRHGTFVNGLPVRERDLQPGDRIQVGGSLFLFAAGEDVAAEPGADDSLGLLDGREYASRLAALALGNIRQIEWLQAEARRLEAALDQGMVGESPRMQEVHRLLARVAPTNATVLLRGESGTGKELAARALHHASPRAGRPFVAINCATLSETLLESELFGHERGSFTGAVERKLGKLEVADSGTVFLDEVGEIPASLQAKLLRVLEEREIERVGGTRPIRVDVRIVAATHRDLEQAIRAGTFRADLYYRLGVIAIALPPLRERREDIPLLASHFAARVSRDLGRRVAGFSPEARACLRPRRSG
jgi:type II secretory pathway predicted ATPase ExeA